MEEQKFIQQNLSKSLPEIALLLSKQPDLNKDYILNQINGLQKAKNKLPNFYNCKGIVYPTKLSMEQCSSQETAVYKSKLLHHAKLVSASIIDLTGGFGVDAYYFSKQYKTVGYVEPNKELFETVTKNFASLNAKNIHCFNGTAEDFFKSNTEKFDVAFIDPSRRNENQKVFQLADCIPNIVDLQHEIFKIAQKILVKTSPILDLKQSIKELKTVAEIWVISVNNECKEVLYLLENKPTSNIKINTVNLSSTNQTLSFTFSEEDNSTPNFSEPLQYLYEPNASVLKAGAFKSICTQFKVNKLAPNTHLYTSEKLMPNFAGRSFKITQVLPYNSTDFKKLGIKKANVSCRNFKETVEQVKKKLNLKDGGDVYLFATTDNNNKPILVVANKVDFINKNAN